MKRNLKMSLAIIGIVTILAINVVIASPQTSHTPLYTFRMEQASSEMNFLLKEKSTFIYTAEDGYQLNTNVPSGYYDDLESLPVTYWNCWESVEVRCWYTARGWDECWLIPFTWMGTCFFPTCHTCPYYTCYICIFQTWNTCLRTCYHPR
jgi:hypothetical protein